MVRSSNKNSGISHGSSKSSIAASYNVSPKKPQQQSFLNTVKEGFSFGIGSSIAHNIVNRVFGSSSPAATSSSPAATSSSPAATSSSPAASTAALNDTQDCIEYMKCKKISDIDERTYCIMRLQKGDYELCDK
jgi:hypothetical protein